MTKLRVVCRQPVGYLDTEKKQAAQEEAALLGQPLPLPEPRS